MQKIKNETQRISISAISFFVLKLNCIIVLNQMYSDIKILSTVIVLI